MGRLRLTSIAALIAAGSLALAACGSDSNSGGGGNSSAPANTNTSVSGGGGTCGSGKLSADGSTAQQNAVNAWIKAYSQQCSGVQITYGGVGSGQGITDFTAGQVDFAGSDAALDPSQGQMTAATKECGSPALDIPMVTGPVAVAFNVKGVTDLTLTPPVIAQIFTGKIKTWDDPAIKALNKSANLPSAKITVFFRSDESGTTQNFMTYLNTAAPKDYTATPSKDWSGVGQGKTGSQGVQSALKSTDDSIGYLEWSYAGSAGLSMAKVDNGGGPVALTADTAGKAVAAAKLASQGGDDLTLKLDYATKTPGAYPIILVTYEIVCSKYKDASVGAKVKAFLTYTSSDAGQKLLPTVGSAPLPASVLSKVQSVVAKIS
ncbi:MAG TPA: phosphate ABC transporter substrate-binding protein PstS [Jatrophihabitantaceae bacterium]